jgi:hypothetical protein
MASDLTEKYVVFTHDHARSCQGREYICSCGHDDKITKAADELVNIIQAQDRRIAELEAALEQCQSVLAMFIDPRHDHGDDGSQRICACYCCRGQSPRAYPREGGVDD